MASSPELDWSDGAPRALAFDDGYFARGDGLAESRAVFLDGLGLPGAWAGRDRLTLGELGFGTGLNVLAALQLWAQARPSPAARLHLFSVEAFPLAPVDAARALAAWPELAVLAKPLLARWPRGRTGVHRFAWPDLNATLDLIVGEAQAAVEGWAGAADGWMLDGFAPSRNPAMWTPALMAAVAARSRPGARAATFTVAGGVRRALQAAGFEVAKRPGHGAKRERLEARLPGAVPADPPRPRVAVIGAGLAGAALARALAAEGLEAVVVEHGVAGAGASGAAAALVTPRLDAGFGAAARLSAQAFARAVALYADETPTAVIGRGVLQLAREPRDADRFARVAAWDGFDPGALLPLAPAEVAHRLGEAAPAALERDRLELDRASPSPLRGGGGVAAPAPTLPTAAPTLPHPSLSPQGGEGSPTRTAEPASKGLALALAEALVVEPAVVLDAWLAQAQRVRGEVAALEAEGARWRLLDAAGRSLLTADAVVLAGGAETAALWPQAPLRPVRGQLEHARGLPAVEAAAWGGYVAPTREGLLFGATHVRGDAGSDPRAEDRAANLAALEAMRPALAAAVRALPPEAVESRAAVRAATPDHLPLAGAAPGRPGLWVLSGLGGRGFTHAPLLAEHVAAGIAGAPSPLARDLAAAVDPARAFRNRPEQASAASVPAAPADATERRP